jgi:hypothetical protein
MKQSDWYGITGMLCLSQIGEGYAIYAAFLAFVVAIVSIFQEK